MARVKFKISRHAREEMERRSIPLALVESVLDSPEQVVIEFEGTKVYQSWRDFGGKMFLIRVIVDDRTEPFTVVTVYRTSKIKYWRER